MARACFYYTECVVDRYNYLLVAEVCRLLALPDPLVLAFLKLLLLFATYEPGDPLKFKGCAYAPGPCAYLSAFCMLGGIWPGTAMGGFLLYIELAPLKGTGWALVLKFVYFLISCGTELAS